MKFPGEAMLTRIKTSPRDATRFSEIIKLHFDALYSAALRLTQNEVEAEDLVQTTCLKALQSFAQLRDTRKAKSWLFRLLTNTFIDEYRVKARGPKLIEIDDVDERYEPWSKTTEESFFDQYLSEEVVAALDELHPNIRLVVWYADVEGFSYAEIAEMLSCSEGTVASRLFRGRNQLKRTLKAYAISQGFLKEDEEK